jgi:hypothetical protein
MALAKNSTRIQIVDEFYGMLRTQLPAIEESYFAEGTIAPLNHKAKKAQRHDEGYQLLACNARFESLLDFFDADINGDDTMSPIQREFIRLAQIFKSRLVVELEYTQRVHERAMIEDRLGNQIEELRAAKEKEDNAKLQFNEAQAAVNVARKNVLFTLQLLGAQLQRANDQAADADRLTDLMAQSQKDLIESTIRTWRTQIVNATIINDDQRREFLKLFDAQAATIRPGPDFAASLQTLSDLMTQEETNLGLPVTGSIGSQFQVPFVLDDQTILINTVVKGVERNVGKRSLPGTHTRDLGHVGRQLNVLHRSDRLEEMRLCHPLANEGSTFVVNERWHCLPWHSLWRHGED